MSRSGRESIEQPVGRGRRRRAALEVALALLLSLFLIFAQQGELRHEIAHFSQADHGPDQKAPADKQPCALCLSYGHLTGAGRMDAFAAQLLTSLSFAFGRIPAIAGASLAALAARNRGPPPS